MSAASDKYLALAIKSIKSKGQELPFYLIKSRDSENTYDPSTLTTSSPDDGEPNYYEFYGAPLDFKLWDKANGTITTGDKMLWMPGTTVTGEIILPEVGDTVTFSRGEGDTYRISEVNTFETNSVNCAFLLRIGV